MYVYYSHLKNQIGRVLGVSKKLAGNFPLYIFYRQILTLTNFPLNICYRQILTLTKSTGEPEWPGSIGLIQHEKLIFCVKHILPKLEEM